MPQTVPGWMEVGRVSKEKSLLESLFWNMCCLNKLSTCIILFDFLFGFYLLAIVKPKLLQNCLWWLNIFPLFLSFYGYGCFSSMHVCGPCVYNAQWNPRVCWIPWDYSYRWLWAAKYVQEFNWGLWKVRWCFHLLSLSPDLMFLFCVSCNYSWALWYET